MIIGSYLKKHITLCWCPMNEFFCFRAVLVLSPAGRSPPGTWSEGRRGFPPSPLWFPSCPPSTVSVSHTRSFIFCVLRLIEGHCRGSAAVAAVLSVGGSLEWNEEVIVTPAKDSPVLTARCCSHDEKQSSPVFFVCYKSTVSHIINDIILFSSRWLFLWTSGSHAVY